MPKFYFLRGAFGDVLLIEEHKQVIKRLLNGDYTDIQLEKLKGHDVYSLRLSKSARLLFAIHPIGGASRLVVLDYLPTHKYKRSRFLQSSLLKRYLSQQELSEMPIVFEETSERPVQPVDGDETQEIDWHVMDYHNQKLIELNLDQQSVMHVPLPALISGGAGSGKSCVALSLLSSWCERRCDALAPVLYVSQSKPLVDSMHRSWMDLPLSGERAKAVLFLTYEKLLCRELSEDTTSEPLQIIGRGEFGTWYLDYIAKKGKVTKAAGTPVAFPDEESAYQEFRIVSGCSHEDYLSLGQRESLVSPEEREMTYAIYQAYLAHLKAAGLIQPAFHSFTPKNQYSMVVVDEAQDFSHWQLIQLGRLAPGAAVFCMDGHQSIQDRRTPRPFTLKHFNIKEASHIQLNLTHRCPERIVTAANQVLLLKHKLQGGTGDKHASTRIDRAPNDGGLGHLFLIEPDQVTQNTWLNTQIGQAHCAIVTAPEHLESASSLFKTPLVFTPETIKGLEFPVVVAYKLYEPTLFREASKRMDELDVHKELKHRPKQGCGDERFAPGFSQIFTAYTRAQCVLVVSEENNKTNKILLDSLRGLAESKAPSEACLQHETFAQDWNQRVLELLNVGNEALAKTLYISKLGGIEASFDAFLVEQRRVPAAIIKPKSEVPMLPAVALTELGSNNPKKPRKALNVSPPPAESVATSGPLPSPDQSSAVARQGQVAKAVLGLVGDFGRKRLEVVMKLSADGGGDVWLTSYYQEDGTKVCLADLLEDETKSDVLMCCLVNNTSLLINKVPYEAILGRIKTTKVRTDIQILREFRSKVLKVKKKFRHDPLDPVFSPVDYAVLLQDVNLIEDLHRMGADVNKPGEKDSPTPVFNAAAMGYAGVITALIACGANPDVTTPMPSGATPTFIAAQLGHSDAITALIAGRANIDTLNHQGVAPVYIAAQNGHAHVITALTAGCANLNSANKEGVTPVFSAAQNGHADAITALLAGGANPNVPLPNGPTPVFMAAQEGYADVIAALIAGGANPDTPMKSDATPTFMAAQEGHADAIAALITGCANPDTPRWDGATPLYIAAKNGHADVTAALIAARADLNKPNNDGETPAFIAAIMGHAGVITLLKDAGANMDTPTPSAETPASIAVKLGHRNVIIALQPSGSSSKRGFFSQRADGTRAGTSPVSPDIKF